MMHLGFSENVDQKVGHGDLLLNISGTYLIRIISLCQLMYLESSENFNQKVGHCDLLMVFYNYIIISSVLTG